MAVNSNHLLLLLVPWYLTFATITLAAINLTEPCKLQQLYPSRPTKWTESDGNINELWDETEEQFQCAGLEVMRNTLKPNFMSLPNYSPASRIVYILQGQGLVGLILTRCKETYQSASRGDREQHIGARKRDRYQKIHRIRQGDIVVIPPGVVHWCYNDGDEDLVGLSVTDLNHHDNHLNYRTFVALQLAGTKPKTSQGSEIEHEGDMTDNIFKPFDENFLAEAMNISVELVKRMQTDDERGLTVEVPGRLDIIRPEEEEEYKKTHPRRNDLEMEESWCNLRITYNVDSNREADFYSREAGRVNIVGTRKLPILQQMEMSIEKGDLHPGAMQVPHYKMNAHSLVYIIGGEGEMKVVDNTGNALFKGTVREGDLMVVPQYFLSMKKAGQKRLEWVSFLTSMLPMETSLAGANSAFRGLPLEVLSNSYQISNKEAQALKHNREDYVKLVPPKISN